MILSEFEKRLQTANPALRIKRYGTGKAGIHHGNQYICRVPQGEITAYTVTQPVIATASQFVTPTNPYGKYKYDLILRRGRHGAAKLLAGRGLIKYADIARIAS